MHINEEYRVLRDFSSHPNLPDFLGVYRKKGDGDNPNEIWFILEVSEGFSGKLLVAWITSGLRSYILSDRVVTHWIGEI